MISSQWETPQTSVENSPSITVSGVNLPEDIKNIVNQIFDKIGIKAKEQLVQQLHQQPELPLFESPEIVYDKNGKIPFPKISDSSLHLDEYINSFQASSFTQKDSEKIQDLLAKYGVVCPGAESVEISKDISDPFVTVITIKKTFF